MSAPLIDPVVLNALLDARDPVRVSAIEVARLITAGCELIESRKHQFILNRTSLSVWSDYLAWRCPLESHQRIIEVYRKTSSTQDVIRRLIEAHGGDADGALAITNEQTAGRGRLGRTWHAPAGWSVLVSRAVVRKSEKESSRSSDHFALVAAVAVARALQSLIAPSSILRIKWPNDILIDGRKVAGILVEAMPSARASIIGIGINILHDPALIPQEVRHRMGSLDMHGYTGDRLRVLSDVVRELDQCLASGADIASMLRTWRAMNLFSSDEVITFEQDGKRIRGTVLDLDAREGLIVRTQDGQIIHLPAATTSVIIE